MKYQKEKVNKQSHLQFHEKITRSKLNQRGEKPIC